MQTRIPTHKFKQPVLALIIKEHANSQRRYCRRLTNGGCAAHSVIMRKLDTFIACCDSVLGVRSI